MADVDLYNYCKVMGTIFLLRVNDYGNIEQGGTNIFISQGFKYT